MNERVLVTDSRLLIAEMIVATIVFLGGWCLFKSPEAAAACTAAYCWERDAASDRRKGQSDD